MILSSALRIGPEFVVSCVARALRYFRGEELLSITYGVEGLFRWYQEHTTNIFGLRAVSSEKIDRRKACEAESLELLNQILANREAALAWLGSRLKGRLPLCVIAFLHD